MDEVLHTATTASDSSAARVDRALAAHPWLFDVALGTGNPYGSAPWLRLFMQQIVDDREVEAVVVEAGEGERAAVMLLSRQRARPWLLRGLSNYYSSLDPAFWSASPDADAAAIGLVRRLRVEQPGCAALQLAPLDAQSPQTISLETALQASGWYVKRYFCFGNWYLPCAGMDFAAYMKQRDSRLVHTWTRKSKKFQRQAADGGRLQIAMRTEEVDVAMDAFETVYAKSWKDAEAYPGFVRGWARVCAERGWLRLGLAWIGEVPVAAQFWFTVEGRAFIFKLAYDEDYASWSAGTVLTAHLMQHSLDVDRVVEIDYLTGDDDYKRGWMSHRRERIGLLACNLQSARGLALAARERAASVVRRWLPKPASG